MIPDVLQQDRDRKSPKRKPVRGRVAGRTLYGFDGAGHPLALELDPRVLAAPAEPVDLALVARRTEAVLGRDARLDAGHLVAAELDHGAALEADQVLVD